MPALRSIKSRWIAYRDPQATARRRALRSLQRARASRSANISPSLRDELDAMMRGL